MRDTRYEIRDSGERLRSFWSWIYIEYGVLDIEEAEDGGEQGDEFATGDCLQEEEDDDDDQQGKSQKGGAPVAEDAGFHSCRFYETRHASSLR